jgi:hypothetical protein
LAIKNQKNTAAAAQQYTATAAQQFQQFWQLKTRKIQQQQHNSSKHVQVIL